MSADKIKIQTGCLLLLSKLFSALDMDLLVSLESVAGLVLATWSMTNGLSYRPSAGVMHT